VITPVADYHLITDTLASAASKVPVVLHGRDMPGSGYPFSGVDMAELGKVMSEQQDGAPFALVGNMSDPTQEQFITPHLTLAGFAGFYEAVTDGNGATAQAIRDNDALEFVMVTDAKYAAGAAAAIQAATAGTDRLIKLGSVFAPTNWKQLFDDKLLHGVFTWDNYRSMLHAAVIAKVMVRDGETLENFYPDILYYSRSTSFNHTSHPYSQDTPSRAGRFW